MKKFKEFIIEFDSPQIYCDMDGVLADFVKFTREHLGQKFTDQKWHDLLLTYQKIYLLNNKYDYLLSDIYEIGISTDNFQLTYDIFIKLNFVVK